MAESLRIAQVAPPIERVPPEGYGGTERVVHELISELVARGHDVTTFASGDSDVPGRLVATTPKALRPLGFGDDPSGFILDTMLQVLDRADDFDIIHSHLEWSSVMLGRGTTVPVAATFHGRLDLPWARPLLQRAAPTWLVAISESQSADHPQVPWTCVHNGLTLTGAPFERRRTDDLCFIGRISPEKGVTDAIEVAIRTGRPLKIAAKLGPTAGERDYNEAVFQPALKRGGSLVEFLGELSGEERDHLVAASYATLMPGSWPEPFGLVAIESLACGTPVIARQVGGLREIIRDGVDGFFGDDVMQLAFNVPRVEELDREKIRASVIDRFSAGRMADGYEALYREMIANGGRHPEIPEADAAVADSADGRVVAMPERLAGTAS
ncbi:MAG TPA: glycosyltransferase family 4 protein [Candidatus Limnocylindrales bacterium]|nr:glycosyltransferase family 4 protein [Candidatus Limnocylindrales bacterium]